MLIFQLHGIYNCILIDNGDIAANTTETHAFQSTDGTLFCQYDYTCIKRHTEIETRMTLI